MEEAYSECGCEDLLEEEGTHCGREDQENGGFPFIDIGFDGVESEEEVLQQAQKAEERRLRRELGLQKRLGPTPKTRSTEEWASFFPTYPTTEVFSLLYVFFIYYCLLLFLSCYFY